jgi:hypothetical protein
MTESSILGFFIVDFEKAWLVMFVAHIQNPSWQVLSWWCAKSMFCKTMSKPS